MTTKTSTFILIKPDGVKRKLVGKILSRFEDKGLEISNLHYLDKVYVNTTEAHYEEHKTKSFFKTITQSLAEGPIIFFTATAVNMNAVKLGRDLIVKIREDYASGLTHENVIHASDSYENVTRELSIWKHALEVKWCYRGE
jgi:nucleoside-diphosphate kinase